MLRLAWAPPLLLLASTLVATAPVASASVAAVLYVSDAGTDTGGCQVSTSPCATVSYAVSQASSGDTIEVSGTIGGPGSSAGVTQIPANFGSLSVIQWPNMPAAVIDGGDSGAVFQIRAGDNVALSGLEIKETSSSSYSSYDGIDSAGGVTVTGSTITGASAGVTNNGLITITDSTITANQTGILNNTGSDTVHLGRSTVSNNRTGISNLGGLLAVSGGTISGNYVGLYGSGGSATVNSSTFSDNAGIGIENQGQLSVYSSTIVGTGTYAGIRDEGGNNAKAELYDTTVTGNIGGGIYNHATALSVTSSTVDGNGANGAGGGIDNDGDPVSLAASIVAGNSGGNCVGGGYSSSGYNLTDDRSAGACGLSASTDLVGVSPALGPLANNGGPTPTMEPASDSPAVARIPLNAILNGIAVCPGTDQRGVSRPQPSNGNACTIGPVEVLHQAAPVINSAAGATFTVGRTANFQVTSTGDPTPTYSESGRLPSGVTFSSSGLLTGAPTTGTSGRYPFTIMASNGVSPDATQSFTLTVVPPTCAGQKGASLADAVGIAAVSVYDCPGYYVVNSYGQVSAFGSAVYHGGLDSATAQIVGVVAKPDSSGYWLVSADGAVYAFGSAGYFGGANNLPLTEPILGIAVTQDAKGYWLVAQDGGIFSYGDARFYGSMGGHHLAQPVDGMAVAPGGNGYWLVASDGGVFTFTSDGFYGSMGGHYLYKPVIGMAGTSDGKGYTLVASDGGVFNFGDSRFYGSLGGNPPSSPVLDLSPAPANDGYYLLDGAGEVFAFGPGTRYSGGV